MEGASFEVQRFPSRFAYALLSSAQGPEVFSSLGGDISKQLQDNSASCGHKTLSESRLFCLNNNADYYQSKAGYYGTQVLIN